MMEKRVKRKLTAILSADVSGYSRLMESDEVWTIKTLDRNKKLIKGLVEAHNGRVVDAPGDNLLAEFISVTDSVECAVKIQQEINKINESEPEDNRMYFRIGVNLGDVIEENGRIYGNGVNIAARLEGLAEPGGICISRTAYDQVTSKLDLGYEYLGEHNVKNITLPVRVYRVLTGSENAGKVIGEKKRVGGISFRVGISAIIILLFIAVGLLFWNLYSIDTEKETPPPFEPTEVTSAPEVKEEGKTIAVLPFDDLSPEKDQEYFVLGLSEEILNYLSKIPGLHVASKTSSFAFKTTDKTIKDIAGILGSEYILEGSVRKAGNAVRITIQLIDVPDDRHLWSEIYDRDLKDIFKIQEDIAKKVAEKLKLTLRALDSGGIETPEIYERNLKDRGKIIARQRELIKQMILNQGVDSNDFMKYLFEEGKDKIPRGEMAEKLMEGQKYNPDINLNSMKELLKNASQAAKQLEIQEQMTKDQEIDPANNMKNLFKEGSEAAKQWEIFEQTMKNLKTGPGHNQLKEETKEEPETQ